MIGYMDGKNKKKLIKIRVMFAKVTQSKSKTQITRNVHGKFNCITV